MGNLIQTNNSLDSKKYPDKIDKSATPPVKTSYDINVSLTSLNAKALEKVSTNLTRGAMVKLARRELTKVRGPIHMPTKVLRVTTRKSPCGNGTATFDKFEMRIHRRMILIRSPIEIVKKIISNAFEPSVEVEVKI